MIRLDVDEGFAFDILSINTIKYAKNIIDHTRYRKVRDNLEQELGYMKFIEVLDSQEYKELMEANLHTFSLVDLAKEDKVLASEVHGGNDWRFRCKTKIMKKFFPHELQIEQKN